MSNSSRANLRQSANNRSSSSSSNNGGDACDECALITLRFFAILVIVILPLELLLLSQGYTFTPYFFLFLLLSVSRSSANNRNSSSSSSSNNNNNNNNIKNPNGLNQYPLPSSVRSHLPLSQDEDDFFRDEEAPSLRNDDDDDPSTKKNNIKAPKIVYPSGISFGSKNRSNPKSLPSGFVQMVQDTRDNTTEVSFASRNKVSNKKDPVDGLREIRYETLMEDLPGGCDGDNSPEAEIVPAKSLVDLTFKRGFQGWNITGTGRRIQASRDDDDDNTEAASSSATTENDDTFAIHRGFLSRSGKMYWEELGERYGVLVTAGVNDTSLANEDCFVDGEWVSSTAFGVEDENERRAHRGTIAGIQCVPAENPSNSADSTTSHKEEDHHSIV